MGIKKVPDTVSLSQLRWIKRLFCHRGKREHREHREKLNKFVVCSWELGVGSWEKKNFSPELT